MVEGHVSLRSEDFDKAYAEFVPLTIRGVDSKSSAVSWLDIGGELLTLPDPRFGHLKRLPGLQYTKRVLRETFEWPAKYAAIFAKCPLRLRSG